MSNETKININFMSAEKALDTLENVESVEEILTAKLSEEELFELASLSKKELTLTGIKSFETHCHLNRKNLLKNSISKELGLFEPFN